jgi:hypothetical protein
MSQEEIDQLQASIAANEDERIRLKDEVSNQRRQLSTLKEQKRVSDIKTKREELQEQNAMKQIVCFEIIHETYGGASYSQCYHLNSVPHGGVSYDENTYHGCDRSFEYTKDVLYGGLKDVYGYHPETQRHWIIKGAISDSFRTRTLQKIGLYPLTKAEQEFAGRFILTAKVSMESIAESNKLKRTLAALSRQGACDDHQTEFYKTHIAATH